MITDGGIAPTLVYDFRTTCEQIFLIKWNWCPSTFFRHVRINIPTHTVRNEECGHDSLCLLCNVVSLWLSHTKTDHCNTAPIIQSTEHGSMYIMNPLNLLQDNPIWMPCAVCYILNDGHSYTLALWCYSNVTFDITIFLIIRGNNIKDNDSWITRIHT